MYDYGARYYDPAIARWGQVDPLADQYAPYSPYNYVLGNPISLTDPTGMSPESSDHDIIVNSSGQIVRVDENDNPHRILTEDGEELYLHDSATDQLELEEVLSVSDFSSLEGFQLVQFISRDNIEGIMESVGAGDGGNIIWNSYSKYDFVYSVLKYDYRNEFVVEERAQTRRGSFITMGGFYVFGERNEYGDPRRSFNIHDAGNSLWGNANRRDGREARTILWGANLNEMANFRWGDSQADMSAILMGYYFR